MAFTFEGPPQADRALRQQWEESRRDYVPSPACTVPWWKFWVDDPHDWALIPGTSMDGYCTRCDERTILRTWRSHL